MATRTTMGLGALLLAAGALIGAPLAAGDADTFNATLARNGVDASTPDIQSANTDLGLAICNILNVSGSPNAPIDELVARGHTVQNANVWMGASVVYLCPEMDSVTHYAQTARPVPSYVPPVPQLSLSEQYQLRYPAFTNGPILDP